MIRRHTPGSDRPKNPIPIKIVICDKNPDTALSLKILLQYCGISVRTVSDLSAVVTVVEEFQPQVILLNIQRDKFGYEVARNLRNLPFGNELILIAHTGFGTKKDLDQAHAAGFDAHLLKPKPFEEVHRTIQALIAKKRGPADCGMASTKSEAIPPKPLFKSEAGV